MALLRGFDQKFFFVNFSVQEEKTIGGDVSRPNPRAYRFMEYNLSAEKCHFHYGDIIKYHSNDV